MRSTGVGGMTPADLVVGKLAAHGCNPRQSPGRDQWTAKCPHGAGHARGDKRPSMSVGVGADGRALVHCETGCNPDDIVRALGLSFLDLFPDKEAPTAKPRIVATYPYFDADGELVFEVVRLDPKGFRQRRSDGRGGLIWDLRGVDQRPLYRLPQVLAAVAAGDTIWIVEGEKDAEALVRTGAEATCNPAGAGKWRPEHTAWLHGAAVVEIVADDDEPGRAHARQVADAIAPHVGEVRLWLPHPGCKDVAEHLGQGRRLTDLRPLDEVADVELGGQLKVGDTDELLAMLIDWGEFWATDHAAESWLAWPILPAGRQVALYAPPKTGKSLLVLAVVVAVATGRPVLGGSAGDPVDVLYLDYEMTRGDLYERLDGMGYGPHVDMSHLHYASLPSLPPLNTEAGANVVLALALAVGAKAVVVDTTGRAVDGDENDSGPYRDFARHTGLALKAAGIALLRTDHAGKDRAKGQRGSSAKNDDVDVVLRLDLADNGYTLARTHSRVGWVPERVAIERTEDVDGFVTFRAARGMTMWPAGTAELASVMDAIGVPLDASRDRARAMGIKGRHKVVLAALKYRRDRHAVDVDGF
jgi:KaiC/GvpD/RAD55 family RecA-like ATPase